MGVTKSNINNITSPDGNSLAVFVDGLTGVVLLKDVNGQTEPLSNYVGTPSPFEYGSCNNAIQPILGNNDSSGNYAIIGGGSSNLSANNHTVIGGGQCNSSLGRNSVVSGGCLNISGTADCCLQTAEVTSSYFLIIDGGYISGSVICVSPSLNYLCLSGNQTNYFIASGAVTNYTLNSPQGYVNINPTSGLSVTSACYNIGNSQTYVGLSPNLPSQFLLSCSVGTTIGGGQNNQALKNFATISGGLNNKITGYSCCATISGGYCNAICVNSSFSKIGGGGCNSIIGNAYRSLISGGFCNTISSNQSIINGGFKNLVSANNSAVLSGNCNIASCYNATVISGYRSVASSNESLVGGGACNKVMDFASAVIGGRSNTVCLVGGYSGIFGGSQNTICGGGCSSVIIGGKLNEINSCCSAILGGAYNKTCGFCKTTIIGSNICATQTCTTFMNCVSAQNLTVGCNVCVGTNKVLVNATAKVGSFFSNVSQSATTINTPKAMTLNNTDAFSSGVSIVSSSRITVDTTGIYNLQFSAQIDRVSGSGTDVIDIWYRKQGLDVADTNTKITIAGNVNESKVVASWNFYVSLTANQYVELMYSVTDLAIQLIYETASLTTPHPATPSLIVTISKIS